MDGDTLYSNEALPQANRSSLFLILFVFWVYDA